MIVCLKHESTDIFLTVTCIQTISLSAGQSGMQMNLWELAVLNDGNFVVLYNDNINNDSPVIITWGGEYSLPTPDSDY